MKFKCAYTALESVEKLLLVQNPKNANKHSNEQIERLAKIIEFQGQRSPIVISKRSGFITKGHGRLQALYKLGWKEAAVDYQEYNTEAEEYADMIADNEIARWAELDVDLLKLELPNLDLGDIDFLGLKDDALDFLNQDSESKESQTDEKYTRKVESPIYKINGPKPEMKDVYNLEKSKELLSKIEQSNISEEMKDFLRFASYRHNVFNYKNIAELYAHASKEEQELMEQSGLIIIDFNKAIELGFVEMTESLKEAYANE